MPLRARSSHRSVVEPGDLMQQADDAQRATSLTCMGIPRVTSTSLPPDGKSGTRAIIIVRRYDMALRTRARR